MKPQSIPVRITACPQFSPCSPFPFQKIWPGSSGVWENVTWASGDRWLREGLLPLPRLTLGETSVYFFPCDRHLPSVVHPLLPGQDQGLGQSQCGPTGGKAKAAAFQKVVLRESEYFVLFHTPQARGRKGAHHPGENGQLHTDLTGYCWSRDGGGGLATSGE